MLRLLLYVLALFLLASMGAWVADNPGEVTLQWDGWQVDTSAAFLLFICIGAGALSYMAWRLAFRILTAPWRLKRHRAQRASVLQLQHATQALVALTAQDTKTARRHLRRLEKSAGHSPLFLLLAAQAARQEQNDGETHALLEQMIEHKETRFLAAHGLSTHHTRQGNTEQALDLARTAHKSNPDHVASLALVLGNYVRMGEWQEALHTLRRARFHVSRKERVRLEGLVYLAHARTLQQEDQPGLALGFAKSAARRLRTFPPVNSLLVRLYETQHQHKAARKLLNKSTPSPQSWQCTECGYYTPDWHAFCPRCHFFGSLKAENRE